VGEQISAEQAVEYGLANKVVPEGEFQAAVDDWAQKLASKSPVLMRLGHDAMYRQQDMDLDDALEFLRSQLSLTFSTEDIQEGVKAFSKNVNQSGRDADGRDRRDQEGPRGRGARSAGCRRGRRGHRYEGAHRGPARPPREDEARWGRGEDRPPARAGQAHRAR